jgi:hypothetical protein
VPVASKFSTESAGFGNIFTELKASSSTLKLASTILEMVPEFSPTTNNSPLTSSAKAEKPPLN